MYTPPAKCVERDLLLGYEHSSWPPAGTRVAETCDFPTELLLPMKKANFVSQYKLHDKYFFRRKGGTVTHNASNILSASYTIVK